jgi:hypothetical protein
MVAYRFYFLDTHNHIAGVEDAVCGNDAQAAKIAVNLLAIHEKQLVIEVWKRERRVSRHSPYSEAFSEPPPWWRIAMTRLWRLADPGDITELLGEGKESAVF